MRRWSCLYFQVSLQASALLQLPLRMIARLMRLEHPASGFGREDAAQVCRALAAAEGNAELDRLAEQMRDAGWLPSHSEEYRRNYAPAYRVIPAVWAPLLPVLCRIAREYAAAERVLVTVDGPCASGKTTLAGMLAEALEAPVLHTDDYVVPHAAKTPQRLAIPGGNCDWERLTKEVLLPWLLGEEAEIRRYDCGADCLLPPEVLPPVPLLLLEGSYVNLPAIRACADVRLFVDAPGPVRMARLARRESPESLARFHARWIPLEEAYFRAYGLPDDGCLIIRCGAGEVPPDRAD